MDVLLVIVKKWDTMSQNGREWCLAFQFCIQMRFCSIAGRSESNLVHCRSRRVITFDGLVLCGGGYLACS